MSSNESEESGGLQSDSSADSASSEQENGSVIMGEIPVMTMKLKKDRWHPKTAQILAAKKLNLILQ